MNYDIIKNNLIGALAGGALVWFFPKLMSVSVSIMYVPSDILGYISKGLSILLGATIGGLIQLAYMSMSKK